MNPIMKGLNQGQPQQQEPLEGIASLAPKQPTQPIPTQPSQPLDPQMTTGIETLDTSNPTIDDPLRFNQVTAPGNIPDRYKEGFVDFYKQNPDDFMRIGGQAISYVTTPQGERIQFGDTGSADNFRRYLESIGESPIPDQFSPLSQQPLPMGQHSLMGLSFRQEGDMGRYVADNDPGGIAAGFSNLKDFLAAGNLPQPTEGVSQDVFGNPNIISGQPITPSQGIASLAAYQSQQNTGPGI